MNSPEWRARTASATADAVDRFFAPAPRAAASPAPEAGAVAASDKAAGADAATRPPAAGPGASPQP